MVERNLETFEHVRALFGLAKFKLSAAAHHVLAVLHILAKHHFQVHNTRLNTIHEGKHVDMEGRLHRRKLIQLIKDLLGVCVFFKVNYDLNALTARFISQVAYADNPFVANQLGNFFYQSRFVNGVRNFGDGDMENAFLVFLNFGNRANDDAAFTRTVGLANCLGAVNLAAGGEVRTFYKMSQIING